MYAATIAVTPISIPPYPGTAVKCVERSIVSRMNLRLSAARSPRLTGRARSLSSFRRGWIFPIVERNYRPSYAQCQVLCITKSLWRGGPHGLDLAVGGALGIH